MALHLTVTDMPALAMSAPHANARHYKQIHERTHVFILEIAQMATVGHHMAAALPACTHATDQSAASHNHQRPRPHA
jgi:hypothetical protein